MNAFDAILGLELSKYCSQSIIAERIQCQDGYSLSVQCGKHQYCSPRINIPDSGIYSSVEVGFVQNAAGDQITVNGWETNDTDGPNGPGDVYGFVPIEWVLHFISDHGGWKY